MPGPEKIQRVAEVTEKLKAARNIFITDYSGLNVVDITELRKKLREAGVIFRVEKNTLLRRAASNLGWDELIPGFKGPTAVALSREDPTVSAKILYEFYNRLEKPKVRVFRIGKRLHQSDELRSLAALPPRDVLLAQLAAAIESPLSSLIGTLEGVIRGFILTIEAMADKRKSAAGSAAEPKKKE